MIEQQTSPNYLTIDVKALAPHFWRWVGARGENECWLWLGQGSRHQFRYGTFWWKEAPYAAHRLAWVLTYGAESCHNLYICHRCDTPACVNPAHLYPGTPADNGRDRSERRRSRAEAEERASQTVEQINELRLQHAAEMLSHRGGLVVPRIKETLRPLLDRRLWQECRRTVPAIAVEASR